MSLGLLALLLLASCSPAGEASIERFEVTKPLINEGDMVTLTWEATSPRKTCVLNWNDGAPSEDLHVACIGTKDVTPSITTNYQINALGADNMFVSKSVKVTVVPK